MSEALAGQRDSGAVNDEGDNTAVQSTTAFLALAAAPTFAIMALLTFVAGRGSPDALCSTASASPPGGMVPMYLLMGAFHAAPWLKLIAGRRSGASSGL